MLQLRFSFILSFLFLYATLLVSAWEIFNVPKAHPDEPIPGGNGGTKGSGIGGFRGPEAPHPALEPQSPGKEDETSSKFLRQAEDQVKSYLEDKACGSLIGLCPTSPRKRLSIFQSAILYTDCQPC